MKIKDIVKNNVVNFSHYRAGNLYYQVQAVDNEVLKSFIFPVPIADCGEATFKDMDKAIFFMRYINQALKEKTFVPI